ncbi:MAG: hypothetical protein EHM72_10825 [Calditrichaeota bacterium]|nr:MAG: hypothetical protein EHM72_10825 [Calditrichota bacterium]
MKNLKTIGTILLAAGLLVLAVSLLADVFGIGSSDRFGARQIIGAVIGALVALVGLLLAGKKQS